jgi:hypothetical protein
LIIKGNITQNAAVSTTLELRACYQALKSWTSAYSYKPPWITEPYAVNYISVLETIEDVAQGSMYTACDGIPRFHVTSRATTQTTSTVTFVQKVWTTYRPGPKNESDEYLKQFPPKPCNWYEWDRDNATNRKVCRELLERKNFDRQLFANDMPIPDDLGDYTEEESCRSNCRVDIGEEVALIYWPPNLSSRDICAKNGYGTAETLAPEKDSPNTVTLDAITFQGENVFLRTALVSYGSPYFTVSTLMTDNDTPTPTKTTLKGPFTFTSPTIYLAHNPILMSTFTRDDRVENNTFSWSTSVLRTAGVIALGADEVYSLRESRTDAAQISGLEYARLIASGKYQPTMRMQDYSGLRMASIDFGHLQDPVPASVYYDARFLDCWGSLKQTHCATITDGSYRPLLLLKDTVWKSMIGDWDYCVRHLIVDPPTALIPAYTLAAPKLAQYGPAQPGENSGPQSASLTASVAQEEPARTEGARPGQRIYSAISTTTAAATATGKRYQPENALYISSGSAWVVDTHSLALIFISLAVQLLA